MFFQIRLFKFGLENYWGWETALRPGLVRVGRGRYGSYSDDNVSLDENQECDARAMVGMWRSRI